MTTEPNTSQTPPFRHHETKQPPSTPKRVRRAKLPTSLRTNVYLHRIGQKFDGECQVHWCKNTVNPFSFHVGHNVPVSKGGTDDIDNLYVICASCNLSMGNRYTIHEFSNMSRRPILLRFKRHPITRCWQLCCPRQRKKTPSPRGHKYMHTHNSHKST